MKWSAVSGKLSLVFLSYNLSVRTESMGDVYLIQSGLFISARLLSEDLGDLWQQLGKSLACNHRTQHYIKLPF